MPEVRVQVLYDFEYTTKEGREIWMKEGERLYLIQKTNDDWWQVLRNSERRPFYVPAAYVEEVQPKKTKTSFRSTRLNEVRLEPKALTKNYRARDDRYDELGSAPYSKRLSEEEDPIYDNECFLVSLSQGDITCRGMKEKRTPQFRREHLAENWEHRSEKSRRAEGHSIETLDHRPPRQVSSATGKKERAVRRGGEEYGRRSDGLMGNSTARLDDGTKDGAEQRQNKPLPLIFHNLAYEGDFEDAEEMKENDSEHHEDITEDLEEVAAHSTSTLLAPTTALPRLRPPSSPLRTRSSPSTPTLATASTHRSHSPAPSSSAPSSASSSPTSVTTPTLFSIPVPTGGSIKSGSSSHHPPPSPSPHQPPVRHLSNGWVEYCDASGRTFFYNGDSGEKSWKPPRRRIRKEEPGDGSRSCSSSPLADGEDTTSRAIQIPSGWRESYDSSAEQTCFVNVVTGAKWYSSNDAEGRVYYFEENSHESSWTLPEVSITSPSQTPPLAGISASPMGSDSFISGRSSGGEEGLGANGHEEVDRDGGSSFALRGEPPMPKVKERQKEWEKATGGRLIQLRENTDKDRGMRNSARTTKTRSMILMDPISGEIKMPSYGKILKDWPELWDGNMCILKEGPLNRTKITENGKKVRKNWSPSHVVLTELFLLFFKDAKTFAATKAGNSGGNSSNEPAASPELCVDLSGASVERGDHLSSRRNVFLVTAILGLQVLCQDDNPQNSESWYQEILKAIRQLPSAVDGSPRQNTLERQTYIEAHSPDEHKKFPRIGRSKSVKVKKDASMEDLSVTEKQVKIRARLKKFFHRRPTMESLVKKGIWKDEPAFGCYLDQVSGEGIPRIPLFVQRCIAAIEAKPENMKADGLYRASGNLSQVQKIRLQVDQYNLEILDVEEDVHVLTGALKLFFRELKEPLIPFSLFSKALSASTNPNRKEQLSEFRELVKNLPMANYDTLKYLLQHLLRVTSYQEFNRMHIANLAIVFGPTLMWPEQESLNMALDLMQQNLVIECLLQEFDSIFLSGR